MRSSREDHAPSGLWLPPQLSNSWVAYTAGDAPLYRIRDGNLEVIGAIKNGTLVAGQLVMTLPGVRLRQRIGCIIPTDGSAGPGTSPGVIIFNTDGTVAQDWAWAQNTTVWLNFRVPIL